MNDLTSFIQICALIGGAFCLLASVLSHSRLGDNKNKLSILRSKSDSLKRDLSMLSEKWKQ